MSMSKAELGLMKQILGGLRIQVKADGPAEVRITLDLNDGDPEVLEEIRRRADSSPGEAPKADAGEAEKSQERDLKEFGNPIGDPLGVTGKGVRSAVDLGDAGLVGAGRLVRNGGAIVTPEQRVPGLEQSAQARNQGPSDPTQVMDSAEDANAAGPVRGVQRIGGLADGPKGESLHSPAAGCAEEMNFGISPASSLPAGRRVADPGAGIVAPAPGSGGGMNSGGGR